MNPVMKAFDIFGEYMFNLLFSPLKKGKQSINQFFIFFQVMGRIFDDMKEDIFRLREESDVITASPVMLPVHGQDRDMPRLEGEDVEAYRTRLSMKGIIAAEAGTRQGIFHALVSLGFKESYIVPRSLQDPERWAEAVLWIGFAENTSISSRRVIRTELDKVKPASAQIILNSFEVSSIKTESKLSFVRLVVHAICNNYYVSPVRFDGTAHFDGSINFNQQIAGHFQFQKMTIKSSFTEVENISAQLIINTKHYFDGTYKFNGASRFNSMIVREDL